MTAFWLGRHTRNAGFGYFGVVRLPDGTIWHVEANAICAVNGIAAHFEGRVFQADTGAPERETTQGQMDLAIAKYAGTGKFLDDELPEFET